MRGGAEAGSSGHRDKWRADAGPAKPPPAKPRVQGEYCPRELITSSYKGWASVPHLRHSPDADYPGEGVTLAEATPAAKAEPEGASSWRLPAAPLREAPLQRTGPEHAHRQAQLDEGAGVPLES